MNELNNSSWFLKESKMHVFSKKCIRNGITFYYEKKEVWLIDGYFMDRQIK